LFNYPYSSRIANMKHISDPNHPLGHLWLSIKSASWWTSLAVLAGSVAQLLF
jgi:hypothetical protein